MKWFCYKKKCNVPTTNIRHFFPYSDDKKVASQSFATIATNETEERNMHVIIVLSVRN